MGFKICILTLLKLFFYTLRMGNNFLETKPCTSEELHVTSQTGKMLMEWHTVKEAGMQGPC